MVVDIASWILWGELLVGSEGSRYDERIDRSKNVARVIENTNEVKRGEHLCPYEDATFTKCGECCSYCFKRTPKHKRVVFLKH